MEGCPIHPNWVRKRQCDELDIRIDDEMIRRVDHTKSLGLTIDDRLSWSNHVDEICRKVSSAIGDSKRIRHFILANAALQIYNALILPHFDYCNPVWECLSGQSSDKLQKLQNRAAKVITLCHEFQPPRRKKQKVLVMHKTIHDLALVISSTPFQSAKCWIRKTEGRNWGT